VHLHLIKHGGRRGAYWVEERTAAGREWPHTSHVNPGQSLRDFAEAAVLADINIAFV
jgi:hypothetical protein